MLNCLLSFCGGFITCFVIMTIIIRFINQAVIKDLECKGSVDNEGN